MWREKVTESDAAKGCCDLAFVFYASDLNSWCSLLFYCLVYNADPSSQLILVESYRQLLYNSRYLEVQRCWCFVGETLWVVPLHFTSPIRNSAHPQVNTMLPLCSCRRVRSVSTAIPSAVSITGGNSCSSFPQVSNILLNSAVCVRGRPMECYLTSLCLVFLPSTLLWNRGQCFQKVENHS